MPEVSEAQIESVVEAIESDEADVDEDDVDVLLEGIVDDDFEVRSPAGDALQELVDGLSEAAIDARFDADRLRGRLAAEDVNAGDALSEVVATLAETSPEAVDELRPEIRAGLGAYLSESTIKEALCTALDTETELVAEAEALMAASDSTARNLGVRLVGEVAGGGYDLEEARPDAAESALPDVWQVLKNGRERKKPRENAAKALAAHAEERPAAYTDRVDEIADLLETTEVSIRSELLDLLSAIADHDPDAVAPAAPLARREFDDVTAWETTRSSAIGLLATLVETHPDVVDSLAPFVDRVRDDDELYDRAAAKVIAAVGDTDHLDALIRASEFDPEFVEALVADASDGERRRAVEELRALATDDDPETRIRAVSAIHEAFFDDVDDPAAVFLDRLDDEGSTGYETVRGAAADGLQRVAADDPERLLDETDRLFEVAAAATTADDRPPTALVDVLAELAETDRDVYARAVDDLWASDEATQYVAASVLAEVATAYPPTLDDPVSRLLDLHDDDDREIAVGGAVRRALGGLAYVRPEAVEPAADRAVEWYREAGDTSGGHRRLVADLASAYPEVTTDLLEALAADYVDTYSGDFRLDDPDLAIALGHAARSGPERVREGIEPLFDRDPDDRPSSLPLVLIGLGDHESVPDGFVGEDGWLEDRLVDNDTERQQLRLVNLLDATAYQPARPLLEAVADGAAASDLVAGAASDALDRSS